MSIRLTEALPKPPPTLDTHVPPPPRVAPSEGPSPFHRLVEGLGKEVNAGEETMRRALHSGGGAMEPSELLALQAGVYRYGEAIDLASKLVDHASQAVKTVITGSGQ